ncbi:hypothetical protein [Streptomyces sp. MS06]|uniref:hypothetical protein n=1 Tax=Streptomyces sp. MS06 TaxID=3385974 RepID=UPI0039A27B3B
MAVGGLREVAAPCVAPGPSGAAVRGRFKHFAPRDETVLRPVGAHQVARMRQAWVRDSPPLTA